MTAARRNFVFANQIWLHRSRHFVPQMLFHIHNKLTDKEKQVLCAVVVFAHQQEKRYGNNKFDGLDECTSTYAEWTKKNGWISAENEILFGGEVNILWIIHINHL